MIQKASAASLGAILTPEIANASGTTDTVVGFPTVLLLLATPILMLFIKEMMWINAKNRVFKVDQRPTFLDSLKPNRDVPGHKNFKDGKVYDEA